MNITDKSIVSLSIIMVFIFTIAIIIKSDILYGMVFGISLSIITIIVMDIVDRL